MFDTLRKLEKKNRMVQASSLRGCFGAQQRGAVDVAIKGLLEAGVLNKYGLTVYTEERAQHVA